MSILLLGGRTAYSRLKIPKDVTPFSTCEIKEKKGIHLAELIKKISLIVWDKAPMIHRHCLEVVDRTLKDIIYYDSECLHSLPFDNKTVLLGGDFR